MKRGLKKNSVIYTDIDGNQLIRFWKAYEGQPATEASTRSWRNNNPGNHAIGDFARKNGAIGFAGKIPNEEGKEFWFAGKLIATVVHTKREPYLRPKTHQQSFREMVIA